MSDKKDHLLIRTSRGEQVERPPVWAMRQAGRWDPEFRKLRGDMDFYEFSQNAELAAQASLLPRRFGVDAIILFYDITTLAVAMGLEFDLVPDRGPVPKRPIRSSADVDRLDHSPEAAKFAHVLRLLGHVKNELSGSLPILVFAGAPFTLASYCIGTGKDLDGTRRFINEHENAWRRLVEKIEKATVGFLKALHEEGADAYQLFDSWAGGLSLREYEDWAMECHQVILRSLPEFCSILFVKENRYVEQFEYTGETVTSLGTTNDLAALRQKYPKHVFQGNVDADLLRTGTPDQVTEATRRCVLAGGGQRHIVNLNHGVHRDTPVENFQAFIRAAKGLS